MRRTTLPSPVFRTLVGLSTAVALLLVGCANPVPPSGGPRDTTPPTIVDARPAEGAVNVPRDITVEMAFSEYIERGSLAEALTVTPAFETPPEVDHDGRSVSISFPEPLRDTTTYILTIDTNLQDVRGVSIDAPITLAFSTGPTINRGQISGQVRHAASGDPAEGMDVYAYLLPNRAAAPPDTLPPRPAYRTQTDGEGQFQFDYLREQPYYVIALADANRNRSPDPLERYAAPALPALVADSTGTRAPRPWVATRLDTIPPQPVRVQSQTVRRHAVRFDAPVKVLDRTPARWHLRDSVAQRRVPVERVYQQARNRRLVLLQTPALAPRPHRLILPDRAVADSAGNAVPPDTLRFLPAEAPDTLQTRFVAFTPPGLTPDTMDVYALLPDESPGVRLNAPLDSTRLRSLITARDTLDAPRPFSLSTNDGTTYRLQFDPPLAPGERVSVRVSGAPLARRDTVFTRRFRRIDNRQLGSLSGTVTLVASGPDAVRADTVRADTVRADTTRPTPGPLVVELLSAAPPARATPRRTIADSTGTFVFPRLPEGTYRFRAFLDLNGNGTWDGGRLLPYRTAEPITWSEGTISNRPRWENVLETPLRVPHPATAQ